MITIMRPIPIAKPVPIYAESVVEWAEDPDSRIIRELGEAREQQQKYRNYAFWVIAIIIIFGLIWGLYVFLKEP